jgi:EAL domain-containing protein (putative c-di-GMP-specific phosphodiesterase class I)
MMVENAMGAPPTSVEDGPQSGARTPAPAAPFERERPARAGRAKALGLAGGALGSKGLEGVGRQTQTESSTAMTAAAALCARLHRMFPRSHPLLNLAGVLEEGLLDQPTDSPDDTYSLGELNASLGDPVGLEARFQRALDRLWMAYQPIVSWSRQAVVALECLVRSDEPTLPSPLTLLDAAERLGACHVLGRGVRARCAVAALEAGAPLVFVNLHASDLLDEELYASAAPLSNVAPRIVLEITERAPLDSIDNVRSHIARLRKLGFRVAVDDLGAGYAGLSSLAQLEPEFVKLDMSLVRDIQADSTKRKLVGSMASLCLDLGIRVIAEGVETAEERGVLVDCGCDWLQGYLFARPTRAFPPLSWEPDAP